MAEGGQRMEGHGLWPGHFDHLQHQQHLQQLQQQQQQQQHMQQQQQQGQGGGGILGAANFLGQNHLAPLVGQQISQLSSMLPVNSQHQSPPTLNMMLGGAMFQGHNGGLGPIQSPPAGHGPNSQGGYLLLGATQQHGAQRPGEPQGMPPAISPNSTPGMPGPPATPPILGLDMGERNVFLGGIGGMGRMVGQPGMDKLGLEGVGMEEGQAMAWNKMQGGILADMFPSMERQFGGQQFGDPRLHGNGGLGQGMTAAAQQAQQLAQQAAHENLARLQQQQQQQQQPQQQGSGPQAQPNGKQPQNQQQQQQQQQMQQQQLLQHHLQQQQQMQQQQQQHQQQQQQQQQPAVTEENGLGRFGNQPVMPAQSPPLPGFQLPPGPRPRPVGGDDSSPGFTPEIPAAAPATAAPEKKEDLVIGSWNDEIGKDSSKETAVPLVAPPGLPPAILHNMSQPPPGQFQRFSVEDNMFGGTFHMPPGAGRGGWGIPKEDMQENKLFRPENFAALQRGRGGWDGGRGRGRGGRGGAVQGFPQPGEEVAAADAGRGGRGGRGADRGGAQARGGRGGRGRGGYRGGTSGVFVDHTEEKAAGKNSAIEETKAMMAKMRLEEKEAIEKHKKEKKEMLAAGLPVAVEDASELPPEAQEAVEAKEFVPGATEHIQPGAYRPKEKRGKEERPDNRGRGRGRGGRGGRGAAQIPNMPPGAMFGLPPGPGDFRTPPFPGMECFFTGPGPQHIGQFPPGFPPNGFGPGFPPGGFPGGYPGPMRGRGGFNRGRGGFPAGFPPRGFPPPMIGNRGGGRGRGGHQGGAGRGREGRPGGGDPGGGDPGGEENPLLSAIDKSSKDGLKDDAAEPDNGSKNLFSGQGVDTSGQLALFAAADYPVDLRARLSEQLVRGTTECMVCLDRVKQTHATWDCHNCYQVFHIHCIKKWSKTAKTDTGGWRCPGCQAVTAHVPKEYRCFCRKMRDPEWNRNQSDVPHSCGEVCGRQLKTEGCVHKCVDLCHPGPCPPCNATINRTCPCGKDARMVKCGVVFHCEGVCGKPLNCGTHQCPDICHEGPCYDCHENVQQSCHCGKAVQEVLCTPDTAGVKDYSCESVCERTLDCENHQCLGVCHSGPCLSCVLTPARVTTCPCGQTRLEKLYERDGVQPRTSCLDPVPTCGLTCGIKLKCGAPSTPHTCSALCHSGPCPTCPNTTEVKCRCGHMNRELNCSELVTKADDARCDKRCTKKRSCGRHKCGQPCCIDIDHVCPLVCGKLLSCTLHRCEEMCHRGNCPTCPRTSFDELHCNCGAAVIYPPVACGTRPPECHEVCRRSHSCEHPVTHSCHSETNCPPCTQLTVKKCFGGHEERKNVACLVEGISCGKPCWRPAPCGKHKCIKVCHAGECLASDSSCQQPCATPRHECGHPCGAPCHEGSPCPDTPCATQERVTCECGHRSATMSCAENSYNRVTTALLATRMADMQAGNSVNLADLARRDRRLECTEECGKLERNKRVALALQIRNPELSSKITPRYSDFMKDWVKKDPNFCNMVHEKLTELVKLAKESKQKSRAYSFDCMNRDKRQLVHEYAEMFGCESESYDAEPKRNVVATALKDKSWLPSISLTEFVSKQKRAPGPILSTTVTKPTLVSMTPLSSMSKAIGSLGESTSTTDTTKIDWFD